MKKILFIVGSTRRNSFNRQLAVVAEEQLRGRATVEWLDFGRLPFFNQDGEFPAPPAVEQVRDVVGQADGLWIFTPEYNASYPGYLKNLVDWLSRPLAPNATASGGIPATAAKGRKATISGVSGKSAAAGSRKKLAELLTFVGMEVYGAEGEGFALDGESFATDRLSLPPIARERLKAQGEGFVEFLG